MMVWNGKSISCIFILLERFAWLCENFAWSCKITFHISLMCCSQAYYVSFCMTVQKFCMVMRSQFSLLLFSCSQNPLLVHFARLCEFFTCSCEIEKHAFLTPLYNFSHFFIFNPPPPPSIKLQSLVQVHFLFLFIHIMYLDHHQLYLFSLIWFISFVTNLSKSYLEMTPKLHKTCW